MSGAMRVTAFLLPVGSLMDFRALALCKGFHQPPLRPLRYTCRQLGKIYEKRKYNALYATMR